MDVSFEPTSAAGGSSVLLDQLRERVQSPVMMETVGTALVAIWKRAFDEPDLRPSPWAPRKDKKKTHPLLKLTGELWRSPRVETFTATTVTLRSDRPYANLHQYGGGVKTRHTGYTFQTKEVPKQSYFYVPPRPSFPILANGKLTPRAEQEVSDAVDGWIMGLKQG